jgi:hypothetical protein
MPPESLKQKPPEKENAQDDGDGDDDDFNESHGRFLLVEKLAEKPNCKSRILSVHATACQCPGLCRSTSLRRAVLASTRRWDKELLFRIPRKSLRHVRRETPARGASTCENLMLYSKPSKLKLSVAKETLAK